MDPKQCKQQLHLFSVPFSQQMIFYKQPKSATEEILSLHVILCKTFIKRGGEIAFIMKFVFFKCGLIFA